MPLVFRDCVATALSTLPFQSTSQACSVKSFGSGKWYWAAARPVSFCSAIHRPSGVTPIALGNPSGLLNSFVVFTMREGARFPDDATRSARLELPLSCCARAFRIPLRLTPAPILAARNSRLLKFAMTIPFCDEHNLSLTLLISLSDGKPYIIVWHARCSGT